MEKSCTCARASFFCSILQAQKCPYPSMGVHKTGSLLFGNGFIHTLRFCWEQFHVIHNPSNASVPCLKKSSKGEDNDKFKVWRNKTISFNLTLFHRCFRKPRVQKKCFCDLPQFYTKSILPVEYVDKVLQCVSVCLICLLSKEWHVFTLSYRIPS